MISVNPFTNEIIQTYNDYNTTEIKRRLKLSCKAFQSWRNTDFSLRSHILIKVASALKAEAAGFANLMTNEMGKLTSSGIAEANKCAWVCEYYAQNAEKFLKDVNIETEADKSYITFNPLGPILAIMPWNFPFWQVFRFAAPAIMAGNTVVLKHASNVSGCALAIENIFTEAGLPSGVFQTLLVPGNKMDWIIKNPMIQAVTLTGSTPAGKAVASTAGACLKKTVLELGGNDAYLILDDADLDKAVQACFTSKMINAGQSCIAAKRFIVVEKIREKFEQKLRDAMSGLY